MRWVDGTTYVGQWSYGQPFGEGKMTFSTGEIYEGTWANSKRCGNGKSIAQGVTYTGEWKDGFKHGFGVEVFTNDGTRSEYRGRYNHGAREGEGSYKWQDGSSYEGEWKANMINGIGTHSWPEGRVYTGQWRQGQMHGIGLYTWKDQKQYEGEYLSDKKHGYGKYTWPDGRMYRGQWRNGKQHGLGEYTSLIGSENDGIAQKQVKYGLWFEGNRKQWFPVSPEVDLYQQLDAIEESLFVEQKEEQQRRIENGQDDTTIEKMTFKKPQKFQERLTRILMSAQDQKKRALAQ